jgi:hypothetical protein
MNMTGRCRLLLRGLLGVGCLAGLWADSSRARKEAPSSPQHLRWAVQLLKGVTREHTSYRHKNESVRWQGVNGAEFSESHTDCSGLVNALMKRSYGLTTASLKGWLGSRRPLAKHYYRAIRNEKRFQRVGRLADVRAGDFIALKYDPATDPGRNTGHIFLVVATPRPRKSSRPVVEGMVQWELTVIDQSRSGHGITDTRHKTNGGFFAGLGQGVFRVYTDRAGRVQGHAWSTSSRSRFRAQKDRPLVVGRLLSSPRP